MPSLAFFTAILNSRVGYHSISQLFDVVFICVGLIVGNIRVNKKEQPLNLLAGCVVRQLAYTWLTRNHPLFNTISWVREEERGKYELCQGSNKNTRRPTNF